MTALESELLIIFTKRPFSLFIKLETWWEDVAYLTSRSPSAPMVNIGGPMNIEDMWPVQDGTQIKRAALMVHGLAVIWQTLYR